MRFPLLILALTALIVLATLSYEKPQPELWVEVHDVSPGYGMQNLDKLLDILDSRADRIVLLVIPNRSGREAIGDSHGFVAFLKRAEAKGAVIGAHGYTHEGFEFFTSREEAERRVREIKEEFERAGFSPRIFYPPRYLVTPPALEVLKAEFPEVYLLDRIVSGNSTLPYATREFTLGRGQRFIMPLAELSLLFTKSEVYRLSIHMAYLNNESLKFLDEFTSWAGFESERRKCDEELLLREALRMEPPPQVRGVKRNAYALLYAANMYSTTREEGYRGIAKRHASYLMAEQRDSGGWGEAEGEATSSYALLESAAATWALSRAYTTGVLSGAEVERSITRAGDALLRKAELLTFFGYSFGLKPNAIGFAALGLESAAEAAQEMGDFERAKRYRRKAVEIGEGLARMQLSSGAWYDGPYRLPGYEWRSVSAWYQGMAVSGVAAAYVASPPGERLRFKESAERGIAFLEAMRRDDGGYYGVLHTNGTLAGDGSIMVLQAYAIAESFGLRAGCEGLTYTASRVKSWDANYAFAVSQMIADLSN
ncbi:DUF2334 domain-containing protein [Candidatus Pyrohabitans sp.]